MAYGQKVDEIRQEYRKWFWDGEFQGTKGVTVSPVDGGIFETYGVFAAEDNSVGVVICNYEDTTWCVNVNAESGRLRKYRLVEDEAWKPIEGEWFCRPGQRPSFYKDKKVKECLWKLAAANGDWEVCAEAVRKIVDD